MAGTTSDFDLAGLRLAAGEGRRLDLWTRIDPLELGGESYVVSPAEIPVSFEVSRMTGHGYALRIRFAATLEGPCMRCLKDARREVEVDAREVDRPTEAGRHAPSARIPVSASGDELSSPYLKDEMLDLASWARDAFVLAVPAQVLCRAECLGLCPECAADLNEAGPEHHHEQPPDPRWAKLAELKLD